MPDYGEIDRTIAELNNPHLTIEEVEKRVQWLSGQSFGDSPRGMQYQNRVQHAVDLGRRRIESGRREEKENQSDRESKVAEKKRLRRQDIAIGVSVLFGLIAAIGVYHSISSSKSQHANTEATPPPTYHQTPAPSAAPTEPASSATPSPKQTATAQPSVRPPES